MAQAGPKATVAIAGSSGLIGSALAAALRAADHPVLRIVRRTPANSEELHWNPESGEFDADALTEVDAVVNLLRAKGLRYATVTGAPATTCPTAVPGCTPRRCAPPRSSTRRPASNT